MDHISVNTRAYLRRCLELLRILLLTSAFSQGPIPCGILLRVGSLMRHVDDLIPQHLAVATNDV